MRRKEYARNPKKRKAYVQQPGFLLVGVDVSKAKHSACIGTQTAIHCRKLEFTPTREGVRLLEQTLEKSLVKNKGRHALIALAPSGIYWQGLYDRLKSCGYDLCLVNCQAVRNNRTTMQDGTSKTEAKDAYRVLALLLQGTFFLPVEREPALQAAYRLMRHPMALKKRVSPLRNQLRAAIHLTFPALNPLITDRTQPTSLRFLQTTPTPAAILRHGCTHFLAIWRPRHRCGQGRPEKFQPLYDLAQHSIGLKAPDRIDEFAIKALADDLADALATPQRGLDQALQLLEPRPDFQLLRQLPRIGAPTPAAMLTAIGDIHQYANGKQLVKLAGLHVRLFESGSSIRKLPKLSHGGSADLRHWLYHYALRLVAHAAHFQAYDARRKQPSPGKGAGPRALMAVCDKLIRMIYRILTAQTSYSPQKDQTIARYYAAQRQAA